MALKNTESHYGLIAILLHWLSAISIIGLFSLGFWMVELDYYHDWYTTAPYWHKGIGIIFAFVLFFRLFWKAINPKPRSLLSSQWLTSVVSYIHFALYLLLVLIIMSGYFIVAADNRALDVLGLFELPANLQLITNQETLMGDWHRYLSYVLIAIVILHIGAALKHHFIDKDSTLKRMLGKHK